MVNQQYKTHACERHPFSRIKCDFYQFYKVFFFIIKLFISTLNIKLLISILLHYSYKKTIKLLPKDTFNSKIVPVCEFQPYLVYAERENTLPLTKKHHKSIPEYQCYYKHFFILFFIKCRTGKNHVRIESLYLIGYQYILYGQYAYNL